MTTRHYHASRGGVVAWQMPTAAPSGGGSTAPVLLRNRQLHVSRGGHARAVACAPQSGPVASVYIRSTIRFTVPSQAVNFTLPSRAVNFTIPSRAVNFTLPSRAVRFEVPRRIAAI